MCSSTLRTSGAACDPRPRTQGGRALPFDTTHERNAERAVFVFESSRLTQKNFSERFSREYGFMDMARFINTLTTLYHSTREISRQKIFNFPAK